MSENQPKADELLRRLEDPKFYEDHGVEVELPEYVKMRVDELKEICAQNPEHPKAVDLVENVEPLSEDIKVTVNRADLFGILKNCKVERKHIGEGHYRKELGAEYRTGRASETMPGILEDQADEEPDVGSTSPADGLDSEV